MHVTATENMASDSRIKEHFPSSTWHHNNQALHRNNHFSYDTNFAKWCRNNVRDMSEFKDLAHKLPVTILDFHFAAYVLIKLQTASSGSQNAGVGTGTSGLQKSR